MYLKMRGHGAGFTIIELTLFLAISGLLLSMMLIGTGSLAARQRFSDSTDSLQAYFQGQYDEVVNGVNVRSSSNECGDVGLTDAGMSSSCLLLGKLLTFNVNGLTIQSQYVFSTVALDGSEKTDSARLDKAKLKVANAETATYELKWGATTFNITRSGSSSRSQVDSIAFLKLPDSGRITQLYYKAGNGSLTNDLRIAVNDPLAYNPSGSLPANPSLSVCIKNDSDLAVARPRSAIFFDQGGGTGSIVTNYSPGALCP